MTEQILKLLGNKETILRFLLKVINDSEREKNGLIKLSESLTRDEPNLKIENIAKCLSTTMKISASQQNTIQQLCIISLIQCQSSGFDSDMAHLLNKLGHGEEALQTIMKNKLKGL